MAYSSESQLLNINSYGSLTTASRSVETTHVAVASAPSISMQFSMGSSTTSLYNTLPLDRDKSEFRLWRFCTGKQEDTKVELIMEVFSTSTTPPYISLSYEWGPTNSAKAIYVNSEPLDVTGNLYQFLVTMRDTAPLSWFWADQISMNQTNVHERNHQVKRMSLIYSNAEEVHVWLGPKSAGTRFGNESLSDQLQPYLVGKNVDRSDAILTCLEIFTRSYWTRLWIVQELRSAQSAIIWYGAHQIRASELYDAIQFFKWNGVEIEAFVNSRDSDKSATWCKWQSITSSRLESIEAILGISATVADKVNARSGAQDWLMVLRDHSHGECKDRRDKIFGLQSLVESKYHIPID